MNNINIAKVLDRLGIDKSGKYEDNFYVIRLADSDEYARYYTLLDSNSINTEYPNLEYNTANSLTKLINYFQLEVDNQTCTIFLIADFANDDYKLKIGVI